MNATTSQDAGHLEPAQLLFERDRAFGRTGMITSWMLLTPHQRDGYRHAASRPGHSYSLAAGQVVSVELSV